VTDDEPCRRSSCCAAPKASSRPSSRPTRSPARCRVAPKLRAELGRDPVILVNLSGRGDKDMHTAAAYFGFDSGMEA